MESAIDYLPRGFAAIGGRLTDLTAEVVEVQEKLDCE